MAELYSVSNWNEIFENNRSREIKELNWVAIPNRHDGSKFAELMSHKNGAQHFAAWILIIQVASRVRDSRGILRRGDGTPHTPLSLSLVTRCPESVFSEAIPRLLSLGWLKSEGKEQIPHDGAGIPHLGAAEQDRIEQDGTEQKPPLPPNGDEWFSDPVFALAWSAWEKERKKKGTVRGLMKLKNLSNGDVKTAIAILNQSADNQWQGLFPMKGFQNGPATHRQERASREYPEPNLRSRTLGE